MCRAGGIYIFEERRKTNGREQQVNGVPRKTEQRGFKKARRRKSTNTDMAERELPVAVFPLLPFFLAPLFLSLSLPSFTTRHAPRRRPPPAPRSPTRRPPARSPHPPHRSPPPPPPIAFSTRAAPAEKASSSSWPAPAARPCPSGGRRARPPPPPPPPPAGTRATPGAAPWPRGGWPGLPPSHAGACVRQGTGKEREGKGVVSDGRLRRAGRGESRQASSASSMCTPTPTHPPTHTIPRHAPLRLPARGLVLVPAEGAGAGDAQGVEAALPLEAGAAVVVGSFVGLGASCKMADGG